MGLTGKHFASIAIAAMVFLKVASLEAASQEVLIKSGTKGLEVDTLVIVPTRERSEALPVLFMQHGFMLSQTYYRDVFSKIAEQGFVVVAPQAYRPGGLPFGKPSTEAEAGTTARAINWASNNLADAIDQAVDFNKLGLINHSRGSKVAWIMLRDKLVEAKAIAAIDPVDGTQDGSGRVTGTSFSIQIPALIIGTGLGSVSGGIFSPACARIGDNFERFYAASGGRTWQMVVQDYGHMDFIDSNNNCGMICNVCASADRGHSREAMRVFLADAIGQFMSGVLNGQDNVLSNLHDQSGSPIKVSVETK